jgi:hypothetical protein
MSAGIPSLLAFLVGTLPDQQTDDPEMPLG